MRQLTKLLIVVVLMFSTSLFANGDKNLPTTIKSETIPYLEKCADKVPFLKENNLGTTLSVSLEDATTQNKGNYKQIKDSNRCAKLGGLYVLMTLATFFFIGFVFSKIKERRA